MGGCISCDVPPGIEYWKCSMSHGIYQSLTGTDNETIIAEYNALMWPWPDTPQTNIGDDGLSNPWLPAGTTVGELMFGFQLNAGNNIFDPDSGFYIESTPQNFISCGGGGWQSIGYLFPESIETGLQCALVENRSNDHVAQNGYLGSEFNANQFYFYACCRKRIEDLAGPENFNDIWPHFYHFYNSEAGKIEVDNYIQSKIDAGTPLTPDCVLALKSNYVNSIQSMYGLINANDWSTAKFSVYDQCNGFQSAFPVMTSYAQYNDPNAYQNYWFKDSIGNTDFTKGFWGNPFWTHDQRAEALTLVLGTDTDGESFLDEWATAYAQEGLMSIKAGGTATDYLYPQEHSGEVSWVTDPKYVGNLPKLANYAIGSEPWHKITTDPKGYDYHNPCLDKGLLDTLMPIAAGAIAGGFGAMFIPGDKAKMIAASSLFVSGYSFAQGVVGYSALAGWGAIDTGKKNEAALALSLGVPVSIYEAFIESGLLPSELMSTPAQIGGLAIAGLLGYTVAYPLVNPLLEESGSLFTILQAPFAYVEQGIEWLFDGCAGHEVHETAVCYCEEANVKPLLAEALIGPIYGTTEKQHDLRLNCLHEAFTEGLWGTDPYAIGECDGNGHMNDPTDCLSAGEWAYQRVPDPSMTATMQAKWAECEHCVDIANPSFLPPRGVDTPCLKYGDNFRIQPNGTCLDMSRSLSNQAPPPTVGPTGFASIY